MRDIIIGIFGNYYRIVIFLHVLSAIFLVGSLFVITFFLSPALDKIENLKTRYGTYLTFFNYYFCFVIVVMMVIIVVSVLMNVGLSLKYGDPTIYIIVHIKEAIWTFLVINFMYMYSKYKKAKKAFEQELMVEVHENLLLIVKYLVPLKLFLGVLAVYFGIIARGW